MFRFDQLIHSRMIVRDIKRQWPATIEIFDDYGFRPSCDDCDLHSLARKHGLPIGDVVTALNLALAALPAEQVR